MRKRLDLHRSFYVGLLLILTGLISSQVHADGIASVNSYVEIKSSATNFKARKESSNGQRSTSGFDFIITPERTDICQQGQSSSICTNTYNFSGLGYVPTGSATSIVFRDTPANSYLVFINDDHDNGTDRTSMIGQIVFDYEILGYWTDPSMTVDFDYVDKLGATYPTSSANGYSARQTENHVHYGSSTTSSTTSGDWVSIGSDKRTLRFGSKNGRPGDYIRVITRAADPVIDFNTTTSSGAESVSSAALTVDLSFVSTQNATVDYTVTGTATGSGTDYTLANGTLTINAGSTSGTITIGSIVNDSLDEANETVIVTLSNPSNALLGSDSVHTYTITDNDNAPVVDFNTTSSNGAESVSSKAITVDLSAASAQNVTVNYAITGTATGSGTDYTLANGTLTINAGATSGTITIAGIVDDSLDEANETVVVTLSSPSNATLGTDSVHTYTITDNDNAPVVDFNTTSSSGAESVSSKDITVDLSAATAQDVTVNYAVTGTATGSGTDYTLANGTLTISAGATSGTITIAGIVDDAITEGSESVILTLSSPSNATLGSDSVHTYTITDNDSLPVVDFNTTSSSGAESVSSKALTVDLSAASTQNVTVDYAVTGTATGSGTDYTLANGTLTISAGATSGTITIAGIVDDGLDEANETVIVTLSSPSNATLGSDSVHTYTITDNDNAPVVDFNTISSNGAESTSSKAITVDLSAASSQNVTVDYAVTGTATGSGTDYTLANGTLTIIAGSTSGTITIASIINDTLDEANETVIVTLSNPSNATLGSDSVHTYTITDNDNAPVVDFNTTSSNGAESVSAKAVTVDLSAASGQNVTVDYAVTGTATGSGTDYTLANGTLTISAGATSGAITIAGIVNDTLDEANETVILTLSSPSNATLGSDSVHTYTITDNDNAPVVDFNTTSSSGAESVSSKAITVDLSAASSQNVTVDYAVTGTATGSGTDYTLANGTLTISAGATSGTITIGSIVDDSLDETNETVILTLSNPSNATLGSDSVHTYTITDNDNAPTVDFELTSSSGAESVSSKAVTVDLSAASSQNVTVDYAVTGTATGSGTDYTLANGTLTINAGSTSGTITIAGIVDDGNVEGNETVILTLSNPSNATVGGDNVHTFTILEPVVGDRNIAFADATSSGSESASSKDLTIQMSASTANDATINYAITGTATGSGTDFTLANGTATIAGGSTSTILTIAGIVDDSLDEPDETIIITLSNPTNANPGATLVHTYTITDNDSAPVIDFNATSSSGAESVSSADLTVDLSAASGQNVTVDYAVTGTATGSGTDYTLANGTLTISAGATSGIINISSIIDDSIDEADETVIVTLSNPSNATLGSDSVHTYTISDDDNSPVVDFNATSSSGAESVASAGLTVDLSAASGQNVTVDYAVTGTATGSGTDYTLANGTLTINAGETNGTITIASIVNDSLDEANETVIVTLSNPSNATLGSDSVHTYTITDNDNAPVVDFNTTSSSGAESVSSKAITVDLSAVSAQDVTVDYAVTGTATGSGTDYTLSNGTLTISAGQTSGTITISNIIDDAADEANETVILTLSNATNATLGSDDTHTYTITDNDSAPVVDFNTTSSSGAESVSSKALTVDLSAVSSQNVTVDYAVTGTATGSGTDYTLANGTLTISAGSTTGLITIAGIIDDSLDEADETVIVTLSNPSNATLGSDKVHTYTITDNDSAPVVDFNTTSSSGAESVSSQAITVDLSAASSQNVTVDYAVTGTATGSGTDYTLANGTLTINSGTSSGTITIASIVNDTLDEDNETVILTLSNPSNASLGTDSVHTYTIADNDDAPVVDFNTTSSTGAESVSSKAITVDLSAVSAKAITVNYALSGTATGSGTDYTLGSGTLSINAGSSTGTITIASIVDDSIDEADETIVLTLSNPSNATLGTDSVHTYTITDNDNTPTIDFNSTSSSGAESVSSKAITVDLSGPSSETVTVDYAVTGSATGTGTDYTLANGTLSIAAGSTTGTITIENIVDDSADEPDETVIITLSSPSNATLGSDDVHTYTIADDDGLPTIDFNAASSNGAEDISSVALTVDLSAASSNDITVDYAVTGTATGSGTDYTLANGTLTISAGATSGTITIAGIVDDDLDEANETVIITLSNPNNAILGNDNVHTYTINDNDGTPSVAFSTTSSSDSESVTTRSISVGIPFATSTAIQVDYGVTGGTAGSGTDYVLSSGSVTIEEGATTGTIVISSIIDDSADEADETIIITLSNPTGATLGSDIVHTAIIADDDSPPVIDFNSTSSSGAESVSSAGLTVDLSEASSQNVTVDYSISGTATGSGEDYTLGAGKLTINAGETSGTITIASIIDDPFDEPDETVIITLSNPVNATLGSDITHTFTINDNDSTPIISFSDPTSSGDESITSATLTVDLSVAPRLDVTVDYVVTGTATGSGQDYTLADGTLSISSGETSGTVTITDIVDDLFDEDNETVIVTLSNPSNATLGSDNVHTYTINDNDNSPTIDFNIISSKSDEPSPSINITVDVSQTSGREISVDYELTGTATGSGTDYNLENGTLIIDAGENTGVITIPGILDDDIAEEDETIIITLSNPTNAILGDDRIYTHTILANDDDKRPILISTNPKDDSTRVPIDSDIILTFDKAVNCESGTINIGSENNSPAFAVSLPNEIVTGCGTEIITINLPADLEYETDYFVLIEKTVFVDNSGNSFKGISDKTEFNFKTPIVLTDPTLKQPVIDNAKAMMQIATRWVDQNINVISKRMKTSSRQGLSGLKVNLNNNVIDSIRNIGVTELEDDLTELPIIELCTIDSSGPKTDPSVKIKVHLSKTASEDIAVDFNVTGSSGKENLSFGEGILNIEAGLKSAVIIIDGIPQEKFGFVKGDKKIFVNLLESSNALLGNNLVFTHTLTDDPKAWTDPNINYFCITEFDKPKSSEPIVTKSSYNSFTLVTDPQFYDQDTGYVETNPDIEISNIYDEREEAEGVQDFEQIKSSVEEWASDPVKVTAEGELKELIGDWSVWIDGEFGEFTLRKNRHSTRILDERSFHVGIDRLSDGGGLYGFALGLGEAKPINRNHESHVESRNYSLSTYGRFEDGSDALQFILGFSKLEFDSDRLDGKELLKGQREANQIYGSLAFIRSFSSESSNWQISPYLRIDASYTEFDKYSEIGGEAALTFDELTLSNVKASIGTDISYLFEGSKFNAMPYLILEYGLDYSETSSQNMFYTVEGPNINYVLQLDNGVKAHNWEVDLGVILEISTDMTTNLGCRWQGRSDYSSDYASITSNDLSSSEICFLELMLSL
ncbi:MAG: Calx-beta domain-containing protein [Pseudomonadota bacterium]|nr:Calx-beta domain-containing protein [Pseudomonadota bacterium]